MKKFIIGYFLIIASFNLFSQNVNYYQDGVNGAENLKNVIALNRSNVIHTVSIKFEGTKGSPYLFNSMVPSYILVNGQDKYIQLDSDINVFNSTVIFTDPSTGKMNEIEADNVKELIFDKYNVQLIYRTTSNLKFAGGMKKNQFYQVIMEKPYGLIMVMNKSFSKADNNPTFNSGKHYNEYKSLRKYYMEDSKGVYRRVYFNSGDQDYLLRHSPMNKKKMANLFPDKKDLIYKEFQAHHDSVSVNIVASILTKFK